MPRVSLGLLAKSVPHMLQLEGDFARIVAGALFRRFERSIASFTLLNQIAYKELYMQLKRVTLRLLINHRSFDYLEGMVTRSFYVEVVCTGDLPPNG